MVLRGVLGIIQMVDLSIEDREAIKKLWDHSSPKLNYEERTAGHARIDKKLNGIYKQEMNQEPDDSTQKPHKSSNSRFEALDDTCGIAIGAFLNPARRHDNPMFDVQPITLEFLDRLELEHRRNSVWSI